MRVAIVHELLTIRGGAERVARVFARMFPDAPVYTLLYNERMLGDWFPRTRVRTSAVERSAAFRLLPAPLRWNHHLHLRRFPGAVEAWDFSDVDLVLGSSSAFAHGIITNGAPKHLCYVHSPARYLWDATHEVLDRAGRGPLGPLRRAYLECTFHDLRIWDTETAGRPDLLLANSAEVRRRIALYWRRESAVLHPPIDDAWLAGDLPRGRREGFLIVSRLTPAKRIDLAIAACNKGKLPLTIVGEGADRARLERLAGPTVRFVGYRTQEDVRALYDGCEALLFPAADDFGLVPVEAMARGARVVAFGQGGARETVVEGVTGAFFGEPAPGALLEAIAELRRRTHDPASCRARAAEFGRERFERVLREHINTLLR